MTKEYLALDSVTKWPCMNAEQTEFTGEYCMYPVDPDGMVSTCEVYNQQCWVSTEFLASPFLARGNVN